MALKTASVTNGNNSLSCGMNWNSHLARQSVRCNSVDAATNFRRDVVNSRRTSEVGQTSQRSTVGNGMVTPRRGSGELVSSVSERLAALRSSLQQAHERTCVTLQEQEEASRKLESQLEKLKGDASPESKTYVPSKMQSGRSLVESWTDDSLGKRESQQSSAVERHDPMIRQTSDGTVGTVGTVGGDPILPVPEQQPEPESSKMVVSHIVPVLKTTGSDKIMGSDEEQKPAFTLAVPKPARDSCLSFQQPDVFKNNRPSWSRISKIKEMIDGEVDPTSSLPTSRGSVFADHTGIFADLGALKDQVREAIAQPEYNVSLLYKADSVFSTMVKSQIMEQLSLFVIAFSALWIAIDADNNKKQFLVEADTVFLVVELCLCAFFLFEWFIRFMAFESKFLGMRDHWFLFDTILCAIMAIETLLLQLLIYPIFIQQSDGAFEARNLGSAQILRIFRLVRLTRIARMARVFQAFPELMILIKGIAMAVRSVFFTLVLLGSSVYVFALIFRQATDNTAIGEKYFKSVTESMTTLLLRCTVPDLHNFVIDISSEHVLLAIMLAAFILLATFTVMNMLIGVLVEVIKVVSAVENEGLLVMHVKNSLFSMLERSGVDKDYNRSLSKNEFHELMVQPQAVRIIQSLGVDAIGLIDFSEAIFSGDRELSFVEFMELVLELRGTNTATVKDIVELRKWLMQEFDDIKECLGLDQADYSRPSVLLGVVDRVSRRNAASVKISSSVAQSSDNLFANSPDSLPGTSMSTLSYDNVVSNEIY